MLKTKHSERHLALLTLSKALAYCSISVSVLHTGSRHDSLQSFEKELDSVPILIFNKSQNRQISIAMEETSRY